MEESERMERRERDKQARAAMTSQTQNQEPVPLFGDPVRVITNTIDNYHFEFLFFFACSVFCV